MKRLRGSFFYTFLSSSLVLVLINLITLLAVYHISRGEQFDQELEQVEIQLQKNLELLNAQFEEIDNMALRLSLDPQIIGTIRLTPPLGNDVYGKLLLLEKRFYHYNQKTTFVDQLFIIFKRSGIVISDFGASPNIENYAKNFFTYEERDYQTWTEEIKLWHEKSGFLPADNIHTMKNDIRAVTYRYPITIGVSSPNAALIALIPVERIEFYFKDLLDKGCAITVYDNADVCLLERNDPSLLGKKTTLRLTEHDIRATLHVPHSYIFKKLKANRVYIIAVLAVNLLILTAVAVLLAKRNSKPLESLLEKLKKFVPEESKPRESSCQWLEKSLEKIVGDRIDTEATITKQWARLRIGFYEQLLRGTFADVHEIEEYLESINLPVPEGPHFVALFSVAPNPNQPERDPRAQKILLHTYVFQNSFPEWHHHQIGPGDVLVIPAGRSFEDFLIKIQMEFFKATGVLTQLCLGRRKEELIHLSESFEEARKVLSTSRREGLTRPQVTSFSSFKTIPHNYVYGKGEEESLRNAVFSGEPDKLNFVLDDIFKKNYDEQIIPTTGKIRLFSDMITTVCDIVRNRGYGLEGIPANFNRFLELYSSQEDFKKRILTVLTPVLSYLNADKKSHNSRLIRDVLDYLELNYRDPMLNQSSVAHRFKINPQYLSRFYREQTGESFSGSLEKMRMEEAGRLIGEMTDDKTLKEIAGETGYLSWNSFYKAFKRYYRITPGEYRKHRSVS